MTDNGVWMVICFVLGYAIGRVRGRRRSILRETEATPKYISVSGIKCYHGNDLNECTKCHYWGVVQSDDVEPDTTYCSHGYFLWDVCEQCDRP